MPKMGISEEFEMQFKDRFTKVNTEVTITVDGRELPNAAIMGEAMEQVIETMQKVVREGYENIPVRDGSTTVAGTTA